MSNDLNLINANYLSYLIPLSTNNNHNQTHPQPFSFNASTTSHPNLYSFKDIDNNFNQNYTKSTDSPTPQIDIALNQNHRALKNLIDMIDNRKNKNTVTGLSFNKSKQCQRFNRFNRKSNEEVKRERQNFVEDLKEVKQKMNEIMRLIDIKIKVNQQKPQNQVTMLDFDLIKQKLTEQSAKLDILQRDNYNKQVIYLQESEEKANSKREVTTSVNRNYIKQTTLNQNVTMQKTENQECLHLKHSFDKLNDDSILSNKKITQKNQSEVILSLAHNHLNSNNVVDFFTKEQKKQQKNTLQYLPSQKTSMHHSPSLSQLSYKQRLQAANLIQQPILAEERDIKIKQFILEQNNNLLRSKSVDKKLVPNNYNNQIKIIYQPINNSLRNSNISNRFINHQNTSYNPHSFGRPTSNIILTQNSQSTNRVPLPILNRPPLTNFSPPPAHSPSPAVPFRSQQKAIIRQWDEESRPDLSFGLSSSISTLRNGQSITNLKKSSRNSQKFSFIQHFANNPEARKKRQESIIPRQQAKQSIVETVFPKLIPRQQSVAIQNPFQQWNNQFNMERSIRRQDMRINDNSMRTIIENSEHKNKDSIIHQTSFFDSSKSGSKPSNKIDLAQKNVMEGGSVYKKKKKGLEVSKRMNQTQYHPNY